MARRPRTVARLVLATSVVGVALATVPVAAGAQEAGPAATPTLAQVLRGEVDGLSAEAATDPEAFDMGIEVTFTNDGDQPVDVAIPFGTLVVTEVEGDQTLTVTPPPTDEVIEAAGSGEVPTIEVDTGRSSTDLPVYCTELDDGYPYDAAEVSPIDDAHPVLADTLEAAMAAEADHYETQAAVWWLTDEPLLPAERGVEELLAVDAEAFAAAPHRVIPDTGYVPVWMRDQVEPEDEAPVPPGPDDEEAAAILDESFEGPASPLSSSDDGGGAGAGLLVWGALVGLVVVAAVVVAARSGRQQGPAPVVARTTPGWYPDPGGSGGHRYWDGQRWTDRVMGPR